MRALNSKNNKSPIAISITVVAQGLFLAFLLMVLVVFILAVLVSFFDWESNTKTLNLLAHAVVVGGAIWAGHRCKKKAWLHGIIVGIGAFLLFNWIGERQGLFITWLWWKRCLRMCFVSMLGGILGGLPNN